MVVEHLDDRSETNKTDNIQHYNKNHKIKKWQENFRAKSSFSSANSILPTCEDITIQPNSFSCFTLDGMNLGQQNANKISNSHHESKKITSVLQKNMQEIKIIITPQTFSMFSKNLQKLNDQLKKISIRYKSNVELVSIDPICLKLIVTLQVSSSSFKGLINDLRRTFSSDIITETFSMSKIYINLIFGSNKKYTDKIAAQNGVSISISPKSTSSNYQYRSKSKHFQDLDTNYHQSFKFELKHSNLRLPNHDIDAMLSEWEVKIQGCEEKVMQYTDKLNMQLCEFQKEITCTEFILKNIPCKLHTNWLYNYLINNHSCYLVLNNDISSHSKKNSSLSNDVINDNKSDEYLSKVSDSSIFNDGDYFVVDFLKSMNISDSHIVQNKNSETLAVIYGKTDNLSHAISYLIGILSLYKREELFIPPFVFHQASSLIKSLHDSDEFLFMHTSFDAKNNIIIIEAIQPELERIKDSIKLLVDEHSKFIYERRFGNETILVDSKLRSNIRLIEEKYSCKIFFHLNFYFVYCSNSEIIDEIFEAIDFTLHCYIDISKMILDISSEQLKYIKQKMSCSIKKFLFGDFNHVRATKIPNKDQHTWYEVQAPFKVLQQVFQKFISALNKENDAILNENQGEYHNSMVELELTGPKYFLFEGLLKTFHPFKNSLTTNIYLSNGTKLILEGKDEDVTFTFEKIISFFDKIPLMDKKIICLGPKNTHIISQILEIIPQVIIKTPYSSSISSDSSFDGLVHVTIYFDHDETDSISQKIDSIVSKFQSMDYQSIVAAAQLISNAFNFPKLKEHLYSLPAIENVLTDTNSQNGIASTVLVYGQESKKFNESLESINDIICNFHTESLKVPKNARIVLQQLCFLSLQKEHDGHSNDDELISQNYDSTIHSNSDDEKSIDNKMVSNTLQNSDDKNSHLNMIDLKSMFNDIGINKEMDKIPEINQQRAICIFNSHNCYKLMFGGSRTAVDVYMTRVTKTLAKFKCLKKSYNSSALRMFQHMSGAERLKIQKQYSVGLGISSKVPSDAKDDSNNGLNLDISPEDNNFDSSLDQQAKGLVFLPELTISVFGLEENCHNFLKYLYNHFYCSQLEIPNYMVGKIIGKKGANLNEMRNSSGCRLKLIKNSTSDHGYIIIIGEKVKVLKLISDIKSLETSFYNQIIKIPESLVPFISYHSTKWIQIKTKFPKLALSLNDDNISITGPKNEVDQAHRMLNEWFVFLSTPFTSMFEIPKNKFGMIVGKKFSNFRKLQKTHNSQILTMKPIEKNLTHTDNIKPLIYNDSLSDYQVTISHDINHSSSKQNTQSDEVIQIKIFSNQQESLDAILNKLNSDIKQIESQYSNNDN